MCFLSRRLFRTYSLPREPHSLFRIPSVYIPHSVHILTPVRMLIIFCAKQPVRQIIEIIEIDTVCFDFTTFACSPLDLFAILHLRLINFALCISRLTIPACSLVPLPFGFMVLTPACFLTILLPVHFVSRISDYVATELLLIRRQCFLHSPWSASGSLPSVTSITGEHHFHVIVCWNGSCIWSCLWCFYENWRNLTSHTQKNIYIYFKYFTYLQLN